jgi:hypothetical protein
MHFQRHDIAHSRQFPYLNSVKVAEGVFNRQENFPCEEKMLLAPAALLVCREDLHPRVIEQVLKAARAIHAPGSKIDPPNRFPTLEGVDVAISETSETYMKSGESFLTRILPYWVMWLVLQMRIQILSLVAVWQPFMKILPMLYSYRANPLLKRHYAALREVESGITHTDNPKELRERLGALEHLRTDMETLSRKVPARLHRDGYHWRLRVSLVRAEALDRLRRMEGEKGPAPTEPSLVPASAQGSGARQ